MAEQGIEELVRRIIRAAQEGVNASRANVASNVSTPDEELRGRLKKEIGSIKKESRTAALVGALVKYVKYHHRHAERLTNKKTPEGVYAGCVGIRKNYEYVGWQWKVEKCMKQMCAGETQMFCYGLYTRR